MAADPLAPQKPLATPGPLNDAQRPLKPSADAFEERNSGGKRVTPPTAAPPFGGTPPKKGTK